MTSAPAACTIASRNYLSHARILAKSYAQHHPGARFYLLIVDEMPEGFDVGADVQLLGLEDLAIPEIFEMCFEYDIAELCTAVKPGLLKLLLERYQEDEVVFFDPDILIMRPLDELEEPLSSASIVLTPNLLKPIPLDGLRPSDQDILIAGAFNLGFIALRKSDQVSEFLRWWDERLRRGGAIVDVPKGLMTDQKWIDLVPSLFSSTAILRDDTYNVAWWNLHHRSLSRCEEKFLVNGRPLAFFHFSGFSPAKPLTLTSECHNRTQVKRGTALADLLELYVSSQMANGYLETSKWRCGYSQFDNGVAVNPPLRRLYLDLDEEARRRFGNPFGTRQPGSFLEWATSPQQEESDLSPFLLSLYQIRFDVWAAYPDVRGRDREAFLEWVRTYAADAIGFDQDLMRVNEVRSLARNGLVEIESSGAEGSPPAVEARDETEPCAESAPSPVDRSTLSANSTVKAAATVVPPEPIRRYQRLMHEVRTVVHAMLPPDATLAVLSKGDDELLELLQLGGRKAWHFPQGADGAYAGFYPADSAEAIEHLEALRQRGANFLVFPRAAFWWLDHYREFKRHLERCYRVVADREDVCLIFALAGSAPDRPGRDAGEDARAALRA